MPDPTAPAPEATISIVAGLDELSEVRAFVREHVAAAGGEGEVVTDLVQAVDELVCNVIGHGYSGRPGRIEVAFIPTASAIGFRIRDDAPPFDPTAHPEPRLDVPLRERRLGGMGVHLARTLTDQFDHRILPTGGNEVTIRKLRRTAGGEASDGHHDRPTEP
jgi:serine/threonine-protein kinase RsbW